LVLIKKTADSFRCRQDPRWLAWNFHDRSKVLPFATQNPYDKLLSTNKLFKKIDNRAKQTKKPCWADTYIAFNNRGNIVYFQIEFLGKGAELNPSDHQKMKPENIRNKNNAAKIYRAVKQNDYEQGFSPEKVPTLYVCETEADKLRYLQDDRKIGFNAPILTKAEYFTLMKAWWYAYAEMTNNGAKRGDFDFQGFITQLADKATDWNIDDNMAIQVMGSFGYGIDKNNLGVRFSGNLADNTDKTNLGVFNWDYTIGKKSDAFNFGTKSSIIAEQFFAFLDLSSDPTSWPYRRFHLWKPF